MAGAHKYRGCVQLYRQKLAPFLESLFLEGENGVSGPAALRRPAIGNPTICHHLITATPPKGLADGRPPAGRSGRCRITKYSLHGGIDRRLFLKRLIPLDIARPPLPYTELMFPRPQHTPAAPISKTKPRATCSCRSLVGAGHCTTGGVQHCVFIAPSHLSLIVPGVPAAMYLPCLALDLPRGRARAA